MRQRARTDSNQAEIVKALRMQGMTVQFLSNVGKGVPDLLVGHQGFNFLFEVKNLDTTYGKKGLNDIQIEWHKNWTGQVAVVSSLDEVLTIIHNTVRTNE